LNRPMELEYRCEGKSQSNNQFNSMMMLFSPRLW